MWRKQTLCSHTRIPAFTWMCVAYHHPLWSSAPREIIDMILDWLIIIGPCEYCLLQQYHRMYMEMDLSYIEPYKFSLSLFIRRSEQQWRSPYVKYEQISTRKKVSKPIKRIPNVYEPRRMPVPYHSKRQYRPHRRGQSRYHKK